MKVVKKVIYVAMASFCLNLTVSSQNITLKMSNITVKQAMDELKSRSGYSFVFSSADVDTYNPQNRPSTFSKRSVSILRFFSKTKRLF